jgi:hypothetical protein
VHVRKKTKRNKSIPYSGLEEKEENRETWVGKIKDFSIIFAIRVERMKRREKIYTFWTLLERGISMSIREEKKNIYIYIYKYVMFFKFELNRIP